jgi:hypothetical protein
LYGTISIKWRNERDSSGRVMSINELKYLKLLFGGLFYFSLIWLSFLAMGVTRNFLSLNGAYTLFKIVYIVLLSALVPLLFLCITVGVVMFFQDKKFDEMITRGLPAR